jgi:hypothetical protein
LGFTVFTFGEGLVERNALYLADIGWVNAFAFEHFGNLAEGLSAFGIGDLLLGLGDESF